MGCRSANLLHSLTKEHLSRIDKQWRFADIERCQSVQPRRDVERSELLATGEVHLCQFRSILDRNRRESRGKRREVERHRPHIGSRIREDQLDFNRITPLYDICKFQRLHTISQTQHKIRQISLVRQIDILQSGRSRDVDVFQIFKILDTLKTLKIPYVRRILIDNQRRIRTRNLARLDRREFAVAIQVELLDTSGTEYRIPILRNVGCIGNSPNSKERLLIDRQILPKLVVLRLCQNKFAEVRGTDKFGKTRTYGNIQRRRLSVFILFGERTFKNQRLKIFRILEREGVQISNQNNINLAQFRTTVQINHVQTGILEFIGSGFGLRETLHPEIGQFGQVRTLDAFDSGTQGHIDIRQLRVFGQIDSLDRRRDPVQSESGQFLEILDTGQRSNRTQRRITLGSIAIQIDRGHASGLLRGQHPVFVKVVVLHDILPEEFVLQLLGNIRVGALLGNYELLFSVRVREGDRYATIGVVVVGIHLELELLFRHRTGRNVRDPIDRFAFRHIDRRRYGFDVGLEFHGNRFAFGSDRQRRFGHEDQLTLHILSYGKLHLSAFAIENELSGLLLFGIVLRFYIERNLVAVLSRSSGRNDPTVGTARHRQRPIAAAGHRNRLFTACITE